MANRFYSAALGDSQPHQIMEGASTSGEAIELRVNDSIYTRKMDVLLGLEALRNYIITRETTPIA